MTLSLSTSQVSADACNAYIEGMYNGFEGDLYGAAHWFTIKGNRVTARNYDGYTSFAMNTGYSREDSVADAAQKDRIYMWKNGGVSTAKFKDVFPSRASGKVDLTTLNIYENGKVEIVLNEWSDATYSLSNLQCYPGHTGSTFMLTGQNRTGSHGLDNWTFLITPAWLI